MKIIVNLDVILAKRKIRSKELAAFVGITEANLSLLKQGKVKGIRFETLSKICQYLDCTPGDILKIETESYDENSAVDHHKLDTEQLC